MVERIKENGWLKALLKRHVESYIKHIKWLEHHEETIRKLGKNVEELKKLRMSLSTEIAKIYKELDDER
ncbi:MAG: hypothetical protein QW228_08635 [Candidatus Aenigmatarchaeota archaeon]